MKGQLKDVVECYEYFGKTMEKQKRETEEMVEYIADIAISFKEYDDIFSPILNNTDQLFSRLNVF